MESQPLARDDDSSGPAPGGPAISSFRLSMRCADGSEREIALRKAKIVIGRQSGCDVHVALPNVATRHCELEHHGDSVTLTDLGSDVGTLHNGRRVNTATLRDGDRIGIGPIEFTLRAGSAAPITRTRNEQPAGTAEVVVVRPGQRLPDR